MVDKILLIQTISDLVSLKEDVEAGLTERGSVMRGISEAQARISEIRRQAELSSACGRVRFSNV